MKKTASFYKKLSFTITAVLTVFNVAAQQNKEVSRYDNQKELTSNTSITFKDGFTVPAGASFRAYITQGNSNPLNIALKEDMHAVISYTAKVPGIIDLTDPKNDIKQVNVEVQTLDHYGRLKEIQTIKATPSYNDVIQLKEYDGMGNEDIKYLPYVEQTGRKNFYNMGYSAVVKSYYNPSNLIRTPSISANNSPFSQIKYDDSPLNRVKETSAPGDDFSMGAGHTVRTSSTTTYSDVVVYKARDVGYTTSSLVRGLDSQNKYYNSLDLYSEYIMNENVYNGPGTVTEIKNKEGELIVRRQSKSTRNGSEYLSTYYVYDDMGNLRFVLPPKAEPDTAVITQEILNELCYQYGYDGRHNVISKKLPGKGWEYMVYNKQNQLVLSQDAIQRSKSPQEWNFIKYDALGRNIITGIYQYGANANENYLNKVMDSVNVQAAQWETKATNSTGYTSNTFPKTWNKLLSVNYYDSYDFPGGNPYPYTGAEVSNMTRGLITGSKTNVLGTNNMLWTVNYYDEDGRIVKLFKQHYKGKTLVAGNYDEISTSYDFTGAALSSVRSHKVSGVEQLRSENQYTYDHMGRKINTWQKIDNGPNILLTQNEYDDFGNLYKKKLHSTNGTNFLQTVTYSYNERGWLSRANAPKFDIKLKYNNPSHGSSPKYNGNITEIEYSGKYSGDRWFSYTYDELDRLTYSEYSLNSQLNEVMQYDKAGNILTLRRGPTTNTPIQYNYQNGGKSNRLESVSGSRVGSFTYDVNGSAITDGTRNNTSIVYNQLNLPSTVTKTGGNATYLYDAAGTKLNSIQTVGSTSTNVDYISGIHYKNGTIDFIATEEGRAVRNSSGVYNYEYNLKDHLGNVRVTIDKYNDTARVIQEDEFYAFGLSVPRYVLGTKNNYLYNGKELQTVLTDEYDYGARFYDPVIGRWNVIDPLAEKGRRWSPYTYAFNSPIRFVDPDGMWPDEGDGPDELTGVQTGMAIGGMIRDGIHGIRNLVAAAGDYLGVNKAAPGMKWKSVDSEGGTLGYIMAQVPSQGARDAVDHLGDGLSALALNGLTARGRDGILMSTSGQETRTVSQALKASVNANSKASTLENTLYRLETTGGEYLKTGITSKENPLKRYTNKFMEDKKMIRLDKGSRVDMLKKERSIVESNPGPLNLEPWAGSKRMTF
nr:DUF6443 domain-containing protein [Pedobacter panaciterrae]